MIALQIITLVQVFSVEIKLLLHDYILIFSFNVYSMIITIDYFLLRNIYILQNMQQKAQNFNQRATHFILGNTNQDSSSIYKHDYTKKQANHQIDYEMIDPFKGNNINPVGQSSFGTTNKALYKDWGKIQPACLDEKKLKDLRSHHFNLGNYGNGPSSTTNKYFYDKKQITDDATKNRQQSKNRMQAHNHDLKEQPYTNFKSMYNKDFDEKQAVYQGNIKPDNQKNAIVFGNNQLPMMTTNKTDFTKKQATYKPINNTLQQSSSLVLGDKPQSMETMNELYYTEKPISKNQLPESTMNQLRNTHFNLGGMSAGYGTQNSQNYHKPPPAALNSKMNMPDCESGTWNPKNAKFNGSTTNQRQLPARQMQPYSKAEPKVKGGFSLGNQGNYYRTQFSQNFDPKPNTYNGKAPKPQDNVATGFDKGTYQTEHRSSFKERNAAQGKIPIDIAAKSKIDHFQIGGNGANAHLTVYQDQFRQDKNNTSKLFHKQNR